MYVAAHIICSVAYDILYSEMMSLELAMIFYILNYFSLLIIWGSMLIGAYCGLK
jgi:hypothetical protein